MLRLDCVYVDFGRYVLDDFLIRWHLILAEQCSWWAAFVAYVCVFTGDVGDLIMYA